MAHPRTYQDSDPTIERLRRLCLALPAVFEKEAWGECTFRITGGRMFAMTDNHHHGSERIAVWLKATLTIQEVLVHTDPKRFFVPPYVGGKGWLGVRLDYKVDWAELADLIDEAHRLSAPKRLRPQPAGDKQEGAKKAATGAAAAKKKRAQPRPRGGKRGSPN